MISKLMLASVVALTSTGTVLADDVTGQAPKPTAQLIKECVAQEMGSKPTVSRADAMKTCEMKVKNAQDPTGTNLVGTGKPDKP